MLTSSASALVPLSSTRHHILKVGLTGGIGSGKSTVCRMLRRAGVPVVYADDLAKKLSRTNPTIRRRLKRLLGNAAYRSDGSLNRAFVARKIFGNRALQRKVNATVHPVVEREVLRQFARWERQGRFFGIMEAALIFEAGFDRQLDLVVVVDAPVATRMKRVRKRDGVPAAEVRSRMRAQWSMKDKVRRADIVVRNSGSLTELRRATRSLHRLLSLMAGGQSA